MQINELVADRRLTQAKAADLFDIPQPHVSDLKRYRLSRFSSERLLRFLTCSIATWRLSSDRRHAGALPVRCPCRLPERIYPARFPQRG